MIPGMCELWSCLPAHNPFPKSGLAMPSDLHPLWAGTTLSVRGVPPCRQVAPQARAESRCEPGPTSWILIFFFPASLQCGGGGKMPGRKKNCLRCPHSARRGNTGLLHSDKSVRHGEHLLQQPRRGGPGLQPSLFSFKDSGFKPLHLPYKRQKAPVMRVRRQPCPLSLCLSRCAGASRMWAP